MSPFEIAICSGIIWASILIVWTLAELTTGDPHPLLVLIMQVYDGFDFTPWGLIVGGTWAFADGFVSGFVISWFGKALFWFFFG
ncbi:MAG: hypothetical protein HQM08_03595 [Candidatus Riflebacteria bacterium]|nr:hypothetical protein [Candidatus Riflebacteria bacterium]